MGPLLAREGVDLSLTTPGQNDRLAFARPSSGDVTLTVAHTSAQARRHGGAGETLRLHSTPLVDARTVVPPQMSRAVR